MRILLSAFAALMIFSGFVWICFCQLEIHPLERAALLAQAEKLPQKQSFTAEDVLQASGDAVRDMADRIPPFWIGACLMLGGAMILNLRKTHK